ncbi:MAG: NAD-binding protein [Actinobacteria bacterium]|nr:NAD-binding protein [Actinomycetota bacterium]
MHVIIAGCGRVGSQLATLLSSEGHNVVVIDKDPGSFQRLELPFNGLTLTGVAFDLDVLREAGIDRADVFAALTNYDNTNLMAAEIATDIFKVPSVLARVYNPDKELTYRSMGISYLCGSTLLAEAFHRMLTWHDIMVHVERRVGCQVVELEANAAGGDLAVAELKELGRVRLMGLLRNERPVFFTRDTRIWPGDHLILAVDLREASLGKLFRSGGAGAVSASDRDALKPGSAAREERGNWKVVVAGCGRVGANLAEMLSLDGYRVAVVDREEDAFRKLSKTYQGEFVHGMAFDLDVLEEAGIEEADAFAALTNYDNTNLMAAEVARGIYGVKRVVSRLYNPDKGETYQALDIDYICGTSLLAEYFMQRMVPDRLKVLSWTANNRVLLVEFTCPRRYHGKPVGRLEREEMLRVGMITRGEEASVASADKVLREKDVIVAAILAPRLHRIRKMTDHERVLAGARRRGA